ncbi:MAG TPA: hypothetical protein VKG78_03045 [Opitutaceae bacterium]|nr:hypothetical protein [Opitutaceae bacterium]
MLNHELVYMQPVSFETAVAWAQEHAPTRSVERFHVRHARAKKTSERKASGKRKACRQKAAGEESGGQKDSTRQETGPKQASKEEV